MADRPEPAEMRHASVDIEREKLALERARLDFAREKLAADRQKARWTAVMIAISLLAIVVTLWVGLLQQYLKARDDAALEAAQIVTAAQDSHRSTRKWEA